MRDSQSRGGARLLDLDRGSFRNLFSGFRFDRILQTVALDVLDEPANRRGGPDPGHGLVAIGPLQGVGALGLALGPGEAACEVGAVFLNARGQEGDEKQALGRTEKETRRTGRHAATGERRAPGGERINWMARVLKPDQDDVRDDRAGPPEDPVQQAWIDRRQLGQNVRPGLLTHGSAR